MQEIHCAACQGREISAFYLSSAEQLQENETNIKEKRVARARELGLCDEDGKISDEETARIACRFVSSYPRKGRFLLKSPKVRNPIGLSCWLDSESWREFLGK